MNLNCERKPSHERSLRHSVGSGRSLLFQETLQLLSASFPFFPAGPQAYIHCFFFQWIEAVPSKCQTIRAPDVDSDR